MKEPEEKEHGAGRGCPSSDLFCVTVPSGEKLGETVYERRVIGLRWNHDHCPPRLEVGYSEKYEEHYSGNRLCTGGFREVWEDVPQFSSQNAQCPAAEQGEVGSD